MLLTIQTALEINMQYGISLHQEGKTVSFFLNQRIQQNKHCINSENSTFVIA